MKNWTACIIATIICRLLGLIAVLAFVYYMVVLTGSLGCLWLLFLLFAVELVPEYRFTTENTKGDKSND